MVFISKNPRMLYAKFSWIGPVFLEKKIYKLGLCIFVISSLYPLWKRRGPSFEQPWIPFTQECFNMCQVWLKLARSSVEEDQNIKNLRTTDDRRSENLTWAFSLGKLNSMSMKLSTLIVKSMSLGSGVLTKVWGQYDHYKIFFVLLQYLVGEKLNVCLWCS